MPTLDLTEQEWQAVFQLLTQAPWHIANPILYKMAKHDAGARRGLGPLPVNDATRRPNGEDQPKSVPEP